MKTKKVRLALCEKQDWKCHYCSQPMTGTGNDTNAPTIEHLIPTAFGGSNNPKNLVASCNKCNTTRGGYFNSSSKLRGFVSMGDLWEPTLGDVWPDAIKAQR